MTGRLKTGIVFGSLLAGAALTYAAEKRVAESQVPKVVLAAVGKKYPDAKFKSFAQESDEGKTLYEVSIATGKGKVDIDVSAEGKILAEETRIQAAELPKTVQDGLTSSKYKGWKVKGWEKVIENEKEDQPVYEGVFLSKAKKVEVVFDARGKITKEEDKALSEKDDE